MIFRKFRGAVLGGRLIEPGDKVLAALSGGQDSMALLELLLDLRREMPFRIVVAHFNHRLRPGAGEDEAFVGAAARARRLLFVSGSRNVRLYARRRRLNVEEAARDLRYEFLRRAARRVGATKIATGHTLTDQAETVLMRIVRGTGLQGLAGIRTRPAGKVIRPLLGIERSETEAFLRRRGVPFRTDETNLDRRFLRNRIRLETLPAFRGADPAVVRHLGRLAELARDEDELLETVTSTAWGELARPDGKAFSLDARALAILPRALARRVVRRFLYEIAGDLRGFSFDDVEDILALKEGKERPLGRRLVVRRDAGRLFLKRPQKAPLLFEMPWNGREKLELPGGARAFRASLIQARKAGAALPHYDDSRRALVDAARVSLPLTVRSRRPGDSYRPLGAPGTKKLKEILRAKKIPLSERDSLPVFLSGKAIVWVPGLPVAERFKITPRTSRILVLERA
jgi:tRNA(Ile)-lysidine synthase